MQADLFGTLVEASAVKRSKKGGAPAGMCAAYYDKDLSFQLELPDGYEPLPSVASRTYEQWIADIEIAVSTGDLRPALAKKIVRSLQRMPEVREEQMVGVSFSGGKDSQCIMMLGVMRYGTKRMFGMFADTMDEWPQTYDFIPEFGRWIGLHVNVIETMGIHKLLREVIPVWPKMGMRHCTKELKMNPQRDWLDEQGFDQVRRDGRGPVTRKNRGSRAFVARMEAPLILVGERWYEGDGRNGLPFDHRDDVLLRDIHRPVADWDIQDVWEFIFWMRSPINPVYLLGITRCACAGCIFANPDELRLLAKHQPHMMDEWVETEAAIGVPRWGKKSLRQIRDEATGQAEEEQLQLFA